MDFICPNGLWHYYSYCVINLRDRLTMARLSDNNVYFYYFNNKWVPEEEILRIIKLKEFL